jgi:ATP-dependent protease ClpP protease subunit
MKGRILIEGVVGEDITLESVRSQVESFEGLTELQVDVNSPGGDVSEGYAILDYLNDLGVEITTRNIGTVASIATVIFLAGQERKSLPNAEFMIHNPWIQPNAPMESSDLMEMGEFLKRTEDKLATFYSENLEVSKEEIEGLMDDETYLDLNEARKIGFVNAEAQKFKAVAKIKFDNMDKQTGLLTDIKNALDKLVSGTKAEAVEVNAMEITLADGMTVWVESEDGDFVGKAIYNEQGGDPLEDGSYALEDGRSLIVAGGIITEIVEAESEDDELEALKAENEELKNELETLRASSEETSKALEAEKEVNAQNGEAINSILAKIEELEAENKAMAKVTVGGEAPLKQPTKAPEVKAEKEGSEGFLAFMKGKGKF